MNGLDTWHVGTYNDRFVSLLYRKSSPYGMAIEAYDRLQGHGYDIITHIEGLPATQYEIIPENNTMSRLLNEEEYSTIAIDVAKKFDTAFKEGL